MKEKNQMTRRSVVSLLGTTALAGCTNYNSSESRTKSPKKITETIVGPTTETEADFQTSPLDGTATTPYQGVSGLRIGGGQVDLHVFSDYALDKCETFWTDTMRYIREYWVQDKIMVNHVMLPKPVNKWSMFLACATMEVDAQVNVVTLEDWHYKLFEELYPDYSERAVEVAANVLGADGEKVVEAGKQRKRSDLLRSDIEYAKHFGVEEPLAVAVDRDVLDDPSADAIESAVDEALADE